MPKLLLQDGTKRKLHTQKVNVIGEPTAGKYRDDDYHHFHHLTAK